MNWSAVADALMQAAQSPLVLVLCLFAVFIAGLVAGVGVASRERDRVDHEQLPLPRMRTANSSLIDLQTKRLLHQAGQRPHVRAVHAPHLKPSYDGRQHAADASRPSESPRG